MGWVHMHQDHIGHVGQADIMVSRAE